MLENIVYLISNERSKLRNEKINICLVSNGRKSRVEKFNEDIKLDAIHLALKPFPFGIKKMMRKFGVKRKETALIGDQIFTDVIAGKLARVKTVLVEPIEPKTTNVEKFKRTLEKSILKLYNKD